MCTIALTERSLLIRLKYIDSTFEQTSHMVNERHNIKNQLIHFTKDIYIFKLKRLRLTVEF